MKNIIKNLPIGKKLLFTFATILTLFAITAAVVITSQLKLKSSYDYMAKRVLVNSNEVNEMRRNIQAGAKFIMYAAATEDNDDMKSYIEEAQKCLDYLEDGANNLYSNSTIDKTVIDDFFSNMTETVSYKDEIFELLNQGKSEEARLLYFDKYYPSLVKANDYLIQIKDYTDERADETYAKVNTQMVITFVLLFAVVFVTFLGTVLLGITLTKNIKLPIREIEAAAKKISQGQLKDVEIVYQSDDELGDLANSMRFTMAGLSSVVEDLAYLMNEMAEGNFNIVSHQEDSYRGEFEPILLSIQKMNGNLSDTLSQIRSASDQVSAGSEQLATSAQSLAEGANEQAGAVEELLATIVDITEGVEKTSESVEQAYELSREYSKQAGESRNEVQYMMDAMKRITETSKKIEGIITEIEDIASQTNLLSLNASIEAARAGEAGKGFAVVADQIGKLAEESANSAVNTKKLIMSSIQEIEDGTKAAQDTSSIIEAVVKGMDQITVSTKEVSGLSKQQAEAMKQAEAGVNQISDVVQTNSSTAEETSATSEELLAQSMSMDTLIKGFQLKES